MKRLGELQAHSAIPVLVDYLDYKRPLTEGEKNGFFLHSPSTPEMYPAIPALFAMGAVAIPPLLDAIQASDSADPKAQNALFTMMQIDREDMPKAIRLLSKESHSRAVAGHSLEAERLRMAAEEGVRHCTHFKDACSNALNGSN